MLDQPEIQAKINDLSATFLEPAAGEGAFLVELLRRKMHVAMEISDSFDEYNQNVLVALSSLYGIELLRDNFETLIMNMYARFKSSYSEGVTKYHKKPVDNVLKSALVIIKANIVQGDTLKQTKSNGEPIVFSEWQLLPKEYGVQKVQRTEYTLKAILNNEGPLNETHNEQLSLFDDDEAEPLRYHYLPVKITDVYKECKELIK